MIAFRLSVILAALMYLSLSACGDNAATAPPSANSPYKEEVESGLAGEFNSLRIPLGIIEVLSPRWGDGAGQPWMKRFSNSYLTDLTALKDAGLVTFKETDQTDTLRLKGARQFEVTLTKKALDLCDPKKSDKEWACIPIGTCRIKTIVKDIEYPQPPSSDNFRLIVGTYERTYSDLGIQLFGEREKVLVLKFRAVLKYNPFNKTYSFQKADYGDPNKDEWTTKNVAG